MNPSVLVTGATNGTGYAIARRFAQEGYDVVITSRDHERACEAALRLSASYPHVRVWGYGLPAPDETPVIELFEKLRGHGILLDTVVLNAANLGIGMDARI